MRFSDLLIQVFFIKLSELFIKLKENIEPYRSKIRPNTGLTGVEKLVSEYNLKNFNEIVNSSFTGPDKDVDLEKLEELKESIDYFFKQHSQNDDEEFRDFIELISIYLIFIARKPLHPPGIIFSNNTTVYKSGDAYYCTGKKYFIKEDFSLCKFCVANSL